LRQIDIQHVLVDDREAFVAAEFLSQVFDQPGIQFNGNDARRALQQFFSQGAAAGANLNYQRLGRRAARGRDALKNRALNEEMLS
jgi:hypothetical protein